MAKLGAELRREVRRAQAPLRSGLAEAALVLAELRANRELRKIVARASSSSEDSRMLGAATPFASAAGLRTFGKLRAGSAGQPRRLSLHFSGAGEELFAVGGVSFIANGFPLGPSKRARWEIWR